MKGPFWWEILDDCRLAIVVVGSVGLTMFEDIEGEMNIKRMWYSKVHLIKGIGH